MDTPEAIRARASALVEYLLAVRALLERPVRTVPATDAFWQVELVWGHAILSATLGGERVRYPLVATPVAIEYDPEATAVSVVPQGPPRLQPDALADLDNRRVADLLDLGNASGQVEVDPWDAAERRDFAGRALRRLGFDTVLGEPGG